MIQETDFLKEFSLSSLKPALIDPARVQEVTQDPACVREVTQGSLDLSNTYSFSIQEACESVARCCVNMCTLRPKNANQMRRS